MSLFINKKINLSVNNLIACLFFFLGLSSTITLLRFNTPIKIITAHNLFMYLIVLMILLFKFNKLMIKNYLFVGYIINVGISLIFVFVSPIGHDWTKTTVINTINYVFFYSVIYFYILINNGDAKRYYFNGLKISIILQLIWEVLQAFFWYGLHRKLNYELFSSISVLSDIKLSQHDIYGNYRFTGLGWQSSNLAMSLLLGYILFDNKYLKLSCIIGIIASTSRVGIVGIVMVVLYEIIICKKKFRIIEKETDLLLLLLFIVIIIYFGIKYSDVLLGIINSLSDVSKRFGDISWDLHFLYYIWIPGIIIKMPLHKVLFGYGLGCSGYAYSHYKGVYIENGPWIPENDFCSTLFGTGLIGVILLYLWYITSMNRRNKYSKDYLILFMIVFAGFMYAYISSWVLIVVMFCMSGKYIDFDKIKKNNYSKYMLDYNN